MSPRQRLTLKPEASGPLERVILQHTGSNWKTTAPGPRIRQKTVEPSRPLLIPVGAGMIPSDTEKHEPRMLGR